MSSTYKTTYLGLNKFVGTDRPKMDDFNFDNETVDQKFQEHVESNLHITEEERKLLGKANYVMGTYTGDGQSSRTLSFEFPIDFGIIFAVKEPLALFQATANITYVYSAMISPSGCSKGVYTTEGGFIVQQTNTNPPDGKKSMLNQEGTTYVYLLFPKTE